MAKTKELLQQILLVQKQILRALQNNILKKTERGIISPSSKVTTLKKKKKKKD